MHAGTHSILYGLFMNLDTISVILLWNNSQNSCIRAYTQNLHIISPKQKYWLSSVIWLFPYNFKTLQLDSCSRPFFFSYRPYPSIFIFVDPFNLLLPFVFCSWVLRNWKFSYAKWFTFAYKYKFTLSNGLHKMSSSSKTFIPAEVAFKKLAESVRTSLEMFTALQAISPKGPVSGPLRLALVELVNGVVRHDLLYFQNFFCSQRC